MITWTGKRLWQVQPALPMRMVSSFWMSNFQSTTHSSHQRWSLPPTSIVSYNTHNRTTGTPIDSLNRLVCSFDSCLPSCSFPHQIATWMRRVEFVSTAWRISVSQQETICNEYSWLQYNSNQLQFMTGFLTLPFSSCLSPFLFYFACLLWCCLIELLLL